MVRKKSNYTDDNISLYDNILNKFNSTAGVILSILGIFGAGWALGNYLSDQSNKVQELKTINECSDQKNVLQRENSKLDFENQLLKIKLENYEKGK